MPLPNSSPIAGNLVPVNTTTPTVSIYIYTNSELDHAPTTEPRHNIYSTFAASFPALFPSALVLPDFKASGFCFTLQDSRGDLLK